MEKPGSQQKAPPPVPFDGAAALDDAIVVALGCNDCGVWRDCREALEAALARFRAEGIDVVARSSWWRSAAWPDPTDPPLFPPVVADNVIHREREEPDRSVDRDAPTASPPEDFGLMTLQNRPPWWNVELGSFVLNFGGRVSVASVKNFQLCERSDHDRIMLQFGRIQGRHSFTMDFQHPLSAVQAFSIAISSLQSKISFG